MYESYYQKEFELLNNYSIDFFNEIIIVVKLKSLKSYYKKTYTSFK